MIGRHCIPVLWLSLLLIAGGAAWQSRAASALPVSTARVVTTVSVTRVLTGDTIEHAAVTAPPVETDEPVREAQVRLSAAGFDPGPHDGVLGPRTSAAIRQYQTAKALAETGTLDQAPLAALGIHVSPPMSPMVARVLNPLKERQKKYTEGLCGNTEDKSRN